MNAATYNDEGFNLNDVALINGIKSGRVNFPCASVYENDPDYLSFLTEVNAHIAEMNDRLPKGFRYENASPRDRLLTDISRMNQGFAFHFAKRYGSDNFSDPTEQAFIGARDYAKEVLGVEKKSNLGLILKTVAATLIVTWLFF